MTRSETDRTHADLIAANRKLIRCMRRRDRLATQLSDAEELLTDHTEHVRALIHALKTPPPPPVPICSDCQHVLGSNQHCETCSDAIGQPPHRIVLGSNQHCETCSDPSDLTLGALYAPPENP